MSASRSCRALCALATLFAAGCRRHADPPKPPPCGARDAVVLQEAPTEGAACVVHLHGKSGTGAATTALAGIRHVCPEGNADGWGGRQWLYFPEAQYDEVRETVRAAIEKSACERVVIHGFSNGAAAAGKFYCRGESFGHKVLGYVLDDPVPDHGVDGCKPDPAVKVRVYWTGALQKAAKGWRCAEEDWTCEGGHTIGIADYARALGTSVERSMHRTHQPQESPREIAAWLQTADAGVR